MYDVSVIVPVYNVQAFLSTCVRSILCQTLSNFEVLLIDDGSTDNSGALCDELAAQDPRIRVFHRENHGIGATRDFGIAQATGDYLCFVDSDDEVLPNLLEDNIRLAREYHADFVVYGYQNRYVSSEGAFLRSGSTSLPPLSGPVSQAEFWANYPEAKYATTSWTRIFRREFVVENHLKFAVRLNEDAYFLGQALNAPFQCIVFNPNVYYFYNIRPASIMTSFQPDFFGDECAARRAEFDAVVRRHEPTPGQYEPFLAGEAAFSALEALKKLSFARKQLSMSERISLIRTFCQRPRVANGLKNCDLNAFGGWKKRGIQLLRNEQYAQAIRFFDLLQLVRKSRDLIYRLSSRFHPAR